MMPSVPHDSTTTARPRWVALDCASPAAIGLRQMFTRWSCYKDVNVSVPKK